MIAFVILWIIVKPGVELGWSLDENVPTTFHVYRTLAKDGNRKLIGVIHANSDNQEQEFFDILTPAFRSIYSIEGVTKNGQEFSSQTLVVNTSEVILTQITILAISILLGWETVMILKYFRLNKYLWLIP
jgi:hypothetical protein